MLGCTNRVRAVASIDYSGAGFTLGGGVQAQSGQYLAGDEANLEPKTRPFAIVDLRGSVKLFGPLSAFGEVSNLLDRHYASFGTFGEADAVVVAGAGFGGEEIESGHGRQEKRRGAARAPRRRTKGISAGIARAT